MAALALPAVLAQMHVILRMAIRARCFELQLLRGLLVTVSAGEFRVRANEGEVRFLAVVELPDAPAIRGMAARAVVAESPLVKVIRTVAVDAAFAGVLVSARHVTLLARHRHMQADEREGREVMVEIRIGAPSRRRVTLRAVDAELPGMHVRCTVTADAARFELLLGNVRSVARVTGHLLVSSFERPSAIARMIEYSRQPLLVAVARIALAAEATCMRVFGTMTALTIARQRVLQAAASMTIRAVDACVDTQQGEAGLLRVIELRSLPARGRMTVGALRAALVAMHVVGRMTGNALLRRVLVSIAEVAGEARDVFVLVSQRECGLVVVEADASPSRAVVTACTVASKPALVRFLSAMTGVAIGWRVAEALAFRMTAVAANGGMRALQREVSATVIELLATELDDVSIPSEVFGVAGVTLQRSGRTGEAAMQSALRAHIGGNFLVARQTELRLPTAIGAVVTVRTALFVLCVRFGELPRHEQRLRTLRISVRCREQTEQHRECPYDPTCDLPHVCLRRLSRRARRRCERPLRRST